MSEVCEESVLNELKEFIYKLSMIDTHEHLPKEEVRVVGKLDLLTTFFNHYIAYAFYSIASIEKILEIYDVSKPLDERWLIFRELWSEIENTTYAKSLKIAAKDLYGIDEINDETYMRLYERIVERNKPGLYDWVLREMAGIEKCINDLPEEVEEWGFIKPVIRLDDYVLIKEVNDLKRLSRRCGFSIHTLNDLLKAIKNEFSEKFKVVAGIKIALAYRRDLYFEKTSFSEAEKAFNKILRVKSFKREDLGPLRITLRESASIDELKPLQDYLIHYAIQLASRFNLPIQVHTGLQAGGLNDLMNTNPTQLTNLFLEYDDVYFDLFHGGYPFYREAGLMAKYFRNVYVNMCWLHVVSETAARKALSEWLDFVPASKIIGFGGDSTYVEEAYGHSVIARENISKVLAEKIVEGAMSKKHAFRVAEMILRSNPKQLYGL